MLSSSNGRFSTSGSGVWTVSDMSEYFACKSCVDTSAFEATNTCTVYTSPKQVSVPLKSTHTLAFAVTTTLTSYSGTL
jgi:hypothetical protein